MMTAPISLERLQSHLRGMMGEARIVPVERLMDDLVVGCVDGRQTACITSAPGGNAGLFVLLLATLEQYADRQLSGDEVNALLLPYLERFGRFYLHTDTHALARLARAMGWPLEDARQQLRNPDPGELDTLRREIVRPAHVGCGHLRRMLEEPEAYGTRLELTVAVLLALLDRIWKGDERLVFDILAGDHLECAVVQIKTRTTNGDPASVVSICPHHGDVELFVNHPEAITYLEAAHAVFLIEEGFIAPDDRDAFVRAQYDLGERQAAETIRALAINLPVYEVTIALDGDAPQDVGVVPVGDAEPRAA